MEASESVPVPDLPRLLTKREVLAITGVSYTTIWQWMREEEFPRSVRVGPQRVAWREDEVRAWLDRLPRSVLKSLDGGRTDA